MFQKFFTDTIQSKFIKELLRNTPLPTYKTVDDDDLVIAGCYYIYKTWIIKCKKTGYLNLFDNSYITVSNYLYIDDDLYLLTGYKRTAVYDIVGDYVFGQKYKFTENYISKYNFYDSDTHYQLGRYLRAYRDIYGIDLMPFYNCFNYKIISGFNMEKEVEYDESGNYKKTKTVISETSDPRYKILAVPIQFNKVYTIAIDSIQPILYKAVLYGNLGVIYGSNYGSTEIKDRTDLTSLLDDTIAEKGSSSFRAPFTYIVRNSDSYIQQFEKYLYLFIKVPIDNQSALVVIEGDYVSRVKKVFGIEAMKELNQIEVNKLMMSELSLLQLNTKTNYAFSYRLYEYLINSVITQQDDLWKDIYRTQLMASCINTPGVWDNELRYKIYNKYMNNKNTYKVDINGYVDVDMERFLLRKGEK